MNRGVYIGPVQKLQGNTCILFKNKQVPYGFLRVQFDDMELTYGEVRRGFNGHLINARYIKGI
ncbi:hypothetical protein MQM1_035 [Aeromonas phage vB_AsaP_MQM1]|nr:hypothetical protein MQM1_035 [Aeromonas phage vB_AsaP_MQM1]